MVETLKQSIRFIRSMEFSREWYIENRTSILRVVGTILVLFLVAYVSPRTFTGTYMIPRVLAVGVALLGGVVLVFMNPSLALLAIIPSAMVVPFSIGTGTGTSINAAILMEIAAIGMWVLDLIVLRKPFRIHSLPVLPALALGGSSILSLIIGQISWFYASHASLFAQIGGMMLYLFAIGAFLVVAHRIGERGLVWMVGSFLVLGGIYILVRILVARIGYPAYSILGRFQSGAFGGLFWVWLLSLLVGQGLFNKNLHYWIRGGLLGLASLTFYVAFFLARGWTSGWLPAVVGIVVVLWMGFPRFRLPIILVTLVTVALAGPMIYRTIESTIMVGDNAYSTLTRLAAWKILFSIVQANPIFGVGPANYYFYTPLFPILNYAVSFNSHNNYVDLLAQTGILGLACFAFFMIQLTRLAIRLLGKVDEGFMKAYLLSAIGGIAGVVVAGILGDWVIPFVYNVGFEGFRASIMGWMFMGGVGAIERFIEERDARENNIGLIKEQA